MQIEAIYHQGQLQFSAPLRFNREHFKLTVNIPDQEIASPESDKTLQHSLRDILDAIIGREFRLANRGKPSINAKALWHQHLEEKYLGR